jgi:hypothetical protein
MHQCQHFFVGKFLRRQYRKQAPDFELCYDNFKMSKLRAFGKL